MFGTWHFDLVNTCVCWKLAIGTWHLDLMNTCVCSKLALGSNEQVDTWTELPAGSNTAAACPPESNVGDFENWCTLRKKILRTVNPLYLSALALRCKMA